MQRLSVKARPVRSILRRTVSRTSKPARLCVVVILFAVVGTVLLFGTHAVTPTGSFEVENGTLSAAVAKITDTTASGSQAVKFGSGGVPVQCASGGTYVWSNLETCGWPGPSNTGPGLSQCPGGVLTNNSGATTRQITITTANKVISCQNITGGLEVNAQNVTIKNSKIAWDGGGAGGYGVVTINEGASATVDHVDLDGMNHTHTCVFDAGTKGTTLVYSMVVKSVNCHNSDDGIFSWWWPQKTSPNTGSDFLVQDSYLHDFTQNAANGHIDGCQTEGAQNGLTTHNTMKIIGTPNDVLIAGGGLDSAFAIWDDWNEDTSPTGHLTTNITISNHLITGGGFAAYGLDRSPGDGSPGNLSPVGGNDEKNIHFTNNSFSTFYN